jgi:hypothetical protein
MPNSASHRPATQLYEDLILMTAQRSSSPLTSLGPSSPLAGPIRPTTHLSNNNFIEDNHLDGDNSDEDVICSDLPNRHSSRDPTYDPESPRCTSTGTPLRNKPYGQRTISEDSASRLLNHAYKPAKCILTGFEAPSGLTVERPHMIPKATRGRKVCQLIIVFQWSVANTRSIVEGVRVDAGL